MKFSVLKFN